MKKRIKMYVVCALVVSLFCGCRMANQTEINIVQPQEVKINTNTSK